MRLAIGILIATVTFSAPADMPKPMKWRQSLTMLKTDTNLPSRTDHLMGSAQLAGMAFFDDGKVATVESVVSYDYLKGVGSHQGFMHYNFEDGGAFVLRFHIESTPTKGNTSVEGKGQVEIIRASGSLAQIPGFAKATGTMEGRRFKLQQTAVVGYQDIELKLNP